MNRVCVQKRNDWHFGYIQLHWCKSIFIISVAQFNLFYSNKAIKPHHVPSHFVHYSNFHSICFLYSHFLSSLCASVLPFCRQTEPKTTFKCTSYFVHSISNGNENKMLNIRWIVTNFVRLFSRAFVCFFLFSCFFLFDIACRTMWTNTVADFHELTELS